MNRKFLKDRGLTRRELMRAGLATGAAGLAGRPGRGPRCAATADRGGLLRPLLRSVVWTGKVFLIRS